MRWDRTTDEPRRVGSGRSLVTHVVRHSLPTLLPLPPPTPLLPSPARRASLRVTGWSGWRGSGKGRGSERHGSEHSPRIPGKSAINEILAI